MPKSILALFLTKSKTQHQIYFRKAQHFVLENVWVVKNTAPNVEHSNQSPPFFVFF
jgi:hypothetical protein